MTTCAYHSLCLTLIAPDTLTCQDCNANISEKGQVRCISCSERTHLCVRCQESTNYDPIKTFKGLIQLRKDDLAWEGVNTPENRNRYETLINEVMSLKYSNITEVKKRYAELFEAEN